MLKVLKFFAFLGCLGVFVWWSLTVPLGDRTLWGHLRAIGRTKESKDLVRGTKDKVTDLKKRIVTEEKLASPQEQLTQADRDQMRRLIAKPRE